MSHWYEIDGTPNHTIIGKNGKERSVNLRDARELNLFPSVTTVLGVLDKPGLNRWKLDQLALSMLTLPKIEGESLEQFKERAKKDSEQQTKDAAEKGEQIHQAFEDFFNGDDFDEEFNKTVFPVVTAIEEMTENSWADFKPEERFACRYGYAGMVDLHNPYWVIDFKTKDGDQDVMDKCRVYDEHIMQLSAYAYGLGFPSARRANVFVSRTHPGAFKIVEHDKCYFDRFEAILNYWHLAKGYKPEWT